MTQAGALLHGEEEAAVGDDGYQGEHKRPEAAGPDWHVAMRPDLQRKLDPFIEPELNAEQLEKAKASVRAEVEQPFRVVKQRFGYVKARYRGLADNNARLTILFALSNLLRGKRLDLTLLPRTSGAVGKPSEESVWCARIRRRP